MKKIEKFLIVIALAAAPAVFAQEFIGTIEARPDTTKGIWVVDGKSFIVGKETRINGMTARTKVSNCVKVTIPDQKLVVATADSVMVIPVKHESDCREAAHHLAHD